MFKKCLAVYLSVYFLLGAMLLPKGDFALLADIPGMYQHYKQIDDPEDVGIADFVVDYLLNGEGIFGTDYYNGHPIPYNTVQFQHEANLLTFVLPSYRLPHAIEKSIYNKWHIANTDKVFPPYTIKLVKPPLPC